MQYSTIIGSKASVMQEKSRQEVSHVQFEVSLLAANDSSAQTQHVHGARADKQRILYFLPALKETEVKSKAVGCYVSCSHTHKYWRRRANISIHAKSTTSNNHHHHLPPPPPSANGHKHKWSHSDLLQASAILHRDVLHPSVWLIAARMHSSSGFTNQKTPVYAAWRQAWRRREGGATVKVLPNHGPLSRFVFLFCFLLYWTM